MTTQPTLPSWAQAPENLPTEYVDRSNEFTTALVSALPTAAPLPPDTIAANTATRQKAAQCFMALDNLVRDLAQHISQRGMEITANNAPMRNVTASCKPPGLEAVLYDDPIVTDAFASLAAALPLDPTLDSADLAANRRARVAAAALIEVIKRSIRYQCDMVWLMGFDVKDGIPRLDPGVLAVDD